MKSRSKSKVAFLLLFILPAITSLIILPDETFAQTEDRKEFLTLTVNWTDFETHFKICMPVEINSPFKAELSTGLTKTQFSGLLRESKESSYRLKFRLEESPSKIIEPEEAYEPELKLDEDYCFLCVPSKLFGYPVDISFLISKYTCK